VRAGEQCGGQESCVEPVMRGFYARGLGKKDLSAQLGRRAGVGGSPSGALASKVTAPETPKFDAFGVPTYLATTGAHVRVMSEREREFVRILNEALGPAAGARVASARVGRLGGEETPAAAATSEEGKSAKASSSAPLPALSSTLSEKRHESKTSARMPQPWSDATAATRVVVGSIVVAAIAAAAIVRRRLVGGIIPWRSSDNTAPDMMPLLQPRRQRSGRTYGALGGN